MATFPVWTLDTESGTTRGPLIDIPLDYSNPWYDRADRFKAENVIAVGNSNIVIATRNWNDFYIFDSGRFQRITD